MTNFFHIWGVNYIESFPTNPAFRISKSQVPTSTSSHFIQWVILYPQGFFFKTAASFTCKKSSQMEKKEIMQICRLQHFSRKFQPFQPFKSCSARARVPEYALKVPIFCGGKGNMGWIGWFSWNLEKNIWKDQTFCKEGLGTNNQCCIWWCDAGSLMAHSCGACPLFPFFHPILFFLLQKGDGVFVKSSQNQYPFFL